MNVFTPDVTKRKRVLKNVCRNHPQWKVRFGVAIALFTVAAGIMCGFTYLLIKHPASIEGVMLFAATALCLACVPFFLALSVKNTAKYKCAFPYSSFTNASLFLGNVALEYAFWRVGPQEPAAYSSKRAVFRDQDVFVYRIYKTNIQSIEIKGDICKIKGNGCTQMPRWAEEDCAVKRNSEEFSFIMAFEQGDADRIIEDWVKQSSPV